MLSDQPRKFAIARLTEAEVRHVQIFLSIWRLDEEAQEMLASFMSELREASERPARNQETDACNARLAIEEAW